MDQIYSRSTFRTVTSSLDWVEKDKNVDVSRSDHASITKLGIFASATGSYNPRWKDEIRSGSNATTSFTGIEYDAKTEFMSLIQDIAAFNPNSVPKDWSRYREISGHFYPNSIVSPPSPPSSVVTSVTNRCISRFIASCDSARSSFEAGQDFGEYKETLHSIKSPFESLRAKTLHYLNTLARSKSRLRGKVPSLIKVLSDSYLEWHFGVAPLISDIAQAAVDAGRFRYPVYPVHGSASERYSYIANSASSQAITLPSMSISINAHYDTQSYGVYSLRYKGAIRSGADDQSRISVIQAYQLYPRNWLPTAWDLLPYSWLADYFVNVGDLIRGLSFVTADLTWGCRTERIEQTQAWQLRGIDSLSPPVASPPWQVLHNKTEFYGGNGHFSAKTVNRRVLDGSDYIPRLEFKFPTSKYAAANIGAILVQRFKSLVPFF